MEKGWAFVSAVRRSIDRRSNSIKRRLRLGRYWEWLPESEIPPEIDVMSMLFPLRYDVMLRKEFFECCDAARTDGSSRQDLVSAARELDYYRWFRDVFVRRNEPNLIGDETAMTRRFEHRVDENVALYESLRKHGFDRSKPIVPHTGVLVLPSTSGRTGEGEFHAGDGCHRIAALLALGHSSLPRAYVRPKRFSTLVPLDNTAVMAKSVSVPSEWLAGL